MDRFDQSVAGLCLFAAAYAVHYLARPFWSNTSVVRLFRIPLSIVAWMGILGTFLPLKGFIEAVLIFAEYPNLGSLGEAGSYAFVFILLGLLYQNSHAFDSGRILPLYVDSVLFRHSVRMKDDVFAKLETHEIISRAKGTADGATVDGLRSVKRRRVDAGKELRELDELRKQRLSGAGSEEIERLKSGSPTDITEVFQMFHMNAFPHPGFENTFRVFVDPASRRCELSVLFRDVIPEKVREANAWFRFRQEMFDVIQVFLSQEWTERFRPFFDSVSILCHQTEQDSFGVPRKRPFLRGMMPASVVEAHRNRIFIATEFERMGTIEWIEGESE